METWHITHHKDQKLDQELALRVYLFKRSFKSKNLCYQLPNVTWMLQEVKGICCVLIVYLGFYSLWDKEPVG